MYWIMLEGFGIANGKGRADLEARSCLSGIGDCGYVPFYQGRQVVHVIRGHCDGLGGGIGDEDGIPGRGSCRPENGGREERVMDARAEGIRVRVCGTDARCVCTCESISPDKVEDYRNGPSSS